MTGLETATSVMQALLIVLLYFVLGFGPGFIVGVWLANRFGGGKNQPLRADQHREAVKRAAAHNAQWHPNHERWQK